MVRAGRPAPGRAGSTCRRRLSTSAAAPATAAHDRELDLAEIARAYVGRTAAKRIGDRATLVLELHDGRMLRIAGVERPGAVRELAERLQQIVPG